MIRKRISITMGLLLLIGAVFPLGGCQVGPSEGATMHSAEEHFMP